MRRYIGGLLFVFGCASLGVMLFQPVTEGTGVAAAFLVLAMIVPGAIWLFRKPRA